MLVIDDEIERQISLNPCGWQLGLGSRALSAASCLGIPPPPPQVAMFLLLRSATSSVRWTERIAVASVDAARAWGAGLPDLAACRWRCPSLRAC